MSIWDRYGNWDEIAQLREIESVKNLIKGNRNVWRPNFCSPSLQYIFEYAADEAKLQNGIDPIAVDFGCGLGRNGPLLRRFFQRVLGVDLPDMISRIKSDLPILSASVYDRLYNSSDVLVEKENLCLLYDSVVFQHIIDKDYVSYLIDIFTSQNSLRTFISVYNAAAKPIHLEVLEEKGWNIWHTEIENLSFENVPHCTTVFRRK